MSMICSVLRVSPSVADEMRGDGDLVVGITGLAYKLRLEADFEQRISSLPEIDRAKARQRQAGVASASLTKMEEKYAADFARMDRLEARAAKYGIPPAISLEKAWDALREIFERAGVNFFDGEPIGPNMGYGPALLKSPSKTAIFSNFLNEAGMAAVQTSDMDQLRSAQIYAWPTPDDDTISDEELRNWLWDYFSKLRAYVDEASASGDNILIWIS